jgi:hypothetical protein
VQPACSPPAMFDRRMARSAGTMPNKTPVSRLVAAMKSSVRPSMERSTETAIRPRDIA